MRERMQRFSNYMNYKGLNDNQVTAQCDLSQGLLSQARRGKSDLGEKTINKILSVYQDLNRVWLLTGTGNMLSHAASNVDTYTHIPYNTSGLGTTYNGSASSSSNTTSNNDTSSKSCSLDSHPKVSDLPSAFTVQLFPVSTLSGPLNDFNPQVLAYECERMISPVKGADFAIQVSGASMAPEYPEGCRVFVKRIKDKSFIEWGKVFVLDTCNGTILRALIPSEREDCVRCVSLNPDPMYAPFDVKKEDIYDIYRVLLCMSIK